jgi:hypothetical protein
VYGRWFYPPVEENTPANDPTGVYNRTSSGGARRSPDRMDEHGRPVFYSPVSGAFWAMHDILGSAIEYRGGRVYDISPDMLEHRYFDLVFMGALLCHLRDPIGALMAARLRRRIIASTSVVLGEPEDEVKPRQYLPYTDVDWVSWWLPNEACFRHWLLAAGCRDVDVSRAVTLRCDVEHRDEHGRLQNAGQVHRVAHAHS